MAQLNGWFSASKLTSALPRPGQLRTVAYSGSGHLNGSLALKPAEKRKPAARPMPPLPACFLPLKR